MEEKPTFEQLLKWYPETQAMMIKLTNDSIHPHDFFQRFPKSKKAIDLLSIAVHPDYKRKGIATILVQKSIEVFFFSKSTTNIWIHFSFGF